MTHTIHPTQHIDYSRGDRLDHLFVVDGDEGTAVLLTVSDTGLDLVLDSQSAGWRDRPRTKGFSLTWAEVIARVLSGEFDHQQWSTDGHVPPTSTTESGSTADDVDESIEDPRLCDCGKGIWCPLWTAWTGPGKTERDALCLEEIHEGIDEEEAHNNG
jgi:hypothetical protein